MSRVKLWFISDTHFGHENMYKFTTMDGVTRVRPEFDSAEEADWNMIARWNQTVEPQDHVYHLGDVAMGSPGLQLIAQCNGHKRLILGNHDNEQMANYRAVGFQKIMSSRVFDGIIFTHIPLHPYSLGSHKIIANVHGHTHERDYWPPIGAKPYVNICVEKTNYTPISLEEVQRRVEIARKGLTDSPPGAILVAS